MHRPVLSLFNEGVETLKLMVWCMYDLISSGRGGEDSLLEMSPRKERE